MGLTQVALAKLAGVSQQTITNIESGRNQSSTHLISIAEALGIPASYLNGSVESKLGGLSLVKMESVLERSKIDTKALVRAMIDVEDAMLYLDEPLSTELKVKIAVAHYEFGDNVDIFSVINIFSQVSGSK